MVIFDISDQVRGLNLDISEEILLVAGIIAARKWLTPRDTFFSRLTDTFFKTEKGIREDDLARLNDVLKTIGEPVLDFQESAWTNYMAMRGQDKINARLAHLSDAKTPAWKAMVKEARTQARGLPPSRNPIARKTPAPLEDSIATEIARRKAGALARATAAQPIGTISHQPTYLQPVHAPQPAAAIEAAAVTHTMDEPQIATTPSTTHPAPATSTKAPAEQRDVEDTVMKQAHLIDTLVTRVAALEEKIIRLNEKLVDIHAIERDRRPPRTFLDPADAPQPDTSSLTFHFDDNKQSNPAHALVRRDSKLSLVG